MRNLLHENIDDNCLKIDYLRLNEKIVSVRKGVAVWIQINNTNSKAFLINFVYRPPNAGQTWIDLYEAQLDRRHMWKTVVQR